MNTTAFFKIPTVQYSKAIDLNYTTRTTFIEEFRTWSVSA